MRVEDLLPNQLSLLREAKADVIRQGLLHATCSDQRFLDAITAMRRNPMIFDTLRSSLRDSGGRLSRGLEILSRISDRLTEDEGFWDNDGWRSTKP